MPSDKRLLHTRISGALEANSFILKHDSRRKVWESKAMAELLLPQFWLWSLSLEIINQEYLPDMTFMTWLKICRHLHEHVL